MASLISGFTYDIFISYRQKDNKYDGWITEFVMNLKRELEATFKEEVDVFHDINPLDGLLETHDVSASLKNKLKSLVFIPIISRTYCDPKSFAWTHEFKAFVEQTKQDDFGLMVKLANGNVTSRVLPVRIHDIYVDDIKLFEETAGIVLRPMDFVYHEIGVNRQLRAKDDDVIKSPNQILYRNQINKVALAVRDLIEGMKVLSSRREQGNSVNEKLNTEKRQTAVTENNYGKENNEETVTKRINNINKEKGGHWHKLVKHRKLISGILGSIVLIAGVFFLLNLNSERLSTTSENDFSTVENLGKSKNYALIVGINNYLDPRLDELERPISDAEMLYNVITSRYAFEKENISLIRNATMAEMTKALEYFIATVSPEDNFLLFYSGHGYWDNSTQNGYWILADTKRNNKEQWFMNSTLRDYLVRIKSKHTLLISDACFDGLVMEAINPLTYQPAALNKLNKLTSRKAITSGIRIVFPENNVFSSNLIERLNENQDKYLTAERLFSGFREKTEMASSKVPQYGIIKSAGDEGGDFIFVLK